MPLQNKPKPGRAQHNRTYEVRFDLRNADDAHIWEWLRSLPDNARQYLIKQAVLHGLAGNTASAPPPARATNEDDSTTFEL